MKLNLKLLKQVLNLPTAPFHEEAVSLFVKNFCRKLRLSVREDSFGNLKVIYKRGGSKPIAYTAHMDHPGFEVIRSGTNPHVQLLGGVPDKYFLKAKVLVIDGANVVKGKVLKNLNKKTRIFLVKTSKSVSKNSFGYFDLPGFRLKNGLIQTKAADNVMSVALLLNFLEVLVRQRINKQVVCIFTRAEEVGFVGAVGVIQKKFLAPTIPVVVLETSSAKGGPVTIGEGPVLRVGDRFSIFGPEMDWWLGDVAKKLKLKDKKFKFQRALLQGGTCEASVYVAKGYLVGGLAFPLGNYHNAGPKNYAAEYIHINDYQNMLRWLLALAQSQPRPKEFSKDALQKLERHFKRHSHRLKHIPK